MALTTQGALDNIIKKNYIEVREGTSSGLFTSAPVPGVLSAVFRR